MHSDWLKLAALHGISQGELILALLYTWEQDVSAKKLEMFRQIFYAETFRVGFVFGFLQTGPNQFVENQKQNQDNTSL